jgi:transcriptional regulator with XRE-family HTH domain
MRLREIRARKLVTVKELSEKSGVSETNIYRLEQRKWLPTLTTIRKLSQALEVEAEGVEEFETAIDRTAKRGS